MKTLHNFKLLGIAMLLAAGLAACDKQPGPAESAGKMIDQTAVDKSNKMGETADKVGDKINATAEKVGDKMSAQSEKTGVAMDDTEIFIRGSEISISCHQIIFQQLRQLH